MNLFARKTTTPDTAAPAISLTKGGAATINLAKDTAATVTAHLDWNGGSTLRRAKGADLELYALYVPANAVTAPGHARQPGHAIYWRNLGSRNQPPHIHHHGDSLTPGRETVTINQPNAQGYVLICAYSAVSNGAGSFKSYDARAVVTDGAGQCVTVPLYDNNNSSYWVAIALIDFTTPGRVAISQAETYSRPGSEARPVLYSDGTFAMDAGPVEFKR